jgi:phosphoglycolate phosphatase-like HAD superfamily hydrolase
MKITSKIKTMFWDFDGVLMNSNEIRDKGFQETLKDYPATEVNQLMRFHRKNGGLSRYVKFRYFFEKIRKESISEEQVHTWANKFSEIMIKSLIDRDLLIEESIGFVKENHKNYQMHIVSGSDGQELRKICKGIEIDQYFKSIHGSPTPKKELVAELLIKHKYDVNSCLLIGDSINDKEAALENNIFFKGFNYRQSDFKVN